MPFLWLPNFTYYCGSACSLFVEGICPSTIYYAAFVYLFHRLLTPTL